MQSTPPPDSLERKLPHSRRQLTYGGIAKLALGTIVGMVTFAILLLIVFVAWSVD